MFSYCADVIGDCGGTFEIALVVGGLFLTGLMLRGTWYLLFEDQRSPAPPAPTTELPAEGDAVEQLPAAAEAGTANYKLIAFAGHELEKLIWLATQGWASDERQQQGYWLVVDHGIYLTPTGEHPTLVRAYAKGCNPYRHSGGWESLQASYAPPGRSEYFLERDLIEEAARSDQDLVAQYTLEGMIVGLAIFRSVA